MQRLLICAALTAACGGSQQATVDKVVHDDHATDLARYTAAQFYETVAITGGSFSHDETRLLISTDETGVFNVYSQPVDGGDRVALTTSTTESMLAVSYFPGDDRFLYSHDQGGNELDHLWVKELDGASKDLTPGDNLKARFAGWSGDRAHFYVETNERDEQAFDLYEYATDGYERRMLFENTEKWTLGSVSDDGRWLSLAMVHTNANSDIYLVDLTAAGAKPKLVAPHEGDVELSPAGFTPDSSKLLYQTDEHGEFQQIWTYDIASDAHALHTRADWDVWGASYSETGKYLVTWINADARTVVTLTDAATGKPVALPELPEGDIVGISLSRSETKLLFYAATDRSSSNLHVVDLPTGKHRQLTDTMNPAIDTSHLVDGQVVRYASFDGREIPGVLYKPRGAAPDRKVPATLWVHGGPGGQSRLGYNPMIQYIVNHGYAVFAVNNRGSSGYGKTFFHLDDRNHGDGDLEDCVYGRKYLESLDWIDGDRVAITGGSYGGFMVLAALAFTPDAFDAGVDIFGVSNWWRTLNSIPPWWGAFAESLYAELGDPKTDEQRLKQISPLFHADQIKKPLLVIQGANDPRVLKVESDEIVAAVKQNGVPVEYVVFDDEGHGFRKKANRITATEAIVRFLDEHLRPKPE